MDVPADLRTRSRVLAAIAVVCLTASGCSRSGPGTIPSSTAHRATTRATDDTAAHRATTPPTGRVRERRAARCRFVDERAAARRVGMRLGRITELREAGRVVGCRIYALQHSTFDASEDLPGPRQPAIEIRTTTYGSTTEAHNAFVRLAEDGTAAQPQRIGPTLGLCFRDGFYAADRGRDWTCDFNRGRTEVVVRTVVTSPALSVARLSELVAARIGGVR